jgi:hypothetical protein
MNKKNEESCKQRKKYIKEIKVSSLVMKFDENLLDLRNENGKICCCVDVYCREKRGKINK